MTRIHPTDAEALVQNEARSASGNGKKTAAPVADTVAEEPRAPGRLAEAMQKIEPRWTLAFVAILGYLIVEYSRLQEMYPVLQPLHLEKVFAGLSIVGLLVSHRVRVDGSASRANDKMLLIFLGGVFATAVLAQSPQTAWPQLINAAIWGFTYFLLSRILVSSDRLRIFTFIMLLLNFKLAQFVVRSYYTLQSMGADQQYLATYGVGAGSTDFFGNSADLGLAMVVVWAITGSLLFGEKKKLMKVFLWIFFTGFFGAILLCGSRGAVVGAVAVALVAWARKPKNIAGVLALLVFGFATYFFLPEGMKAKMISAEDWRHDPTAFHRTLLWKAGVRMFEEHPIFGVGLGNFGYVYWTNYSEYLQQDPAARWYARAEWVPHSIYIQSLSETGLVGTIPLFLLCVFCFRSNIQTRRHLEKLGLANRSGFEYRLSVGLDLALVGYLVSGAFIAVIYYPHLWFLLGLSTALNTACLKRQPEPASAESGNPERKLALAIS